MEAKELYEERLKWFIDRIGKRVYRNAVLCGCVSCKSVHAKGLIIGDKMHAYYLCDMEGAYAFDNIALKYFDTQKEADEYEKKMGLPKQSH